MVDDQVTPPLSLYDLDEVALEKSEWTAIERLQGCGECPAESELERADLDDGLHASTVTPNG